MLRRMMAVTAAAVIMAGLIPATAGASDTVESRSGSKTYLALGDSVAAGSGPDKPFTTRSFANVLYRRVHDEMDLDRLVNLSCPGEDSVEMFDDSIAEAATPGAVGSNCYGDRTLPGFPGGADSQLGAAEAYLSAHPGEVALITITIGANDLLVCDFADAEVEACVGRQLTQLGTFLPQILGRLRAAAPGVPIIGMNYYNPNLAYYFTPGGEAVVAATTELSAAFNGVLGEVYGAFRVPVADVARTFRIYDDHGDVPRNVRRNCRLTFMCDRTDGAWTISSDPDIHPNKLGHKHMGRAFQRELRGAGAIS